MNGHGGAVVYAEMARKFLLHSRAVVGSNLYGVLENAG
jgi:hypothetical protein